MLGKLIKYEMKATGRILIPVFAALLVISLMSGLSHIIFPNEEMVYTMVGSLTRNVSDILYMLFLGGTGMLCALMSVVRFRTSILGPEGYLMNTLPLRPISNIISKLAVTTFFQLIGIIIAFVSFFMIADIKTVFSQLCELIGNLAAMEPREWSAMISVFLSLVGAVVLFNVTVYTAFSIGYSFSGKKTVISVCIFVALIVFGSYAFGWFMDAISSTSLFFGATQFYLTFAFESFFIAVGLVLTNYFLSERLNLE